MERIVTRCNPGINRQVMDYEPQLVQVKRSQFVVETSHNRAFALSSQPHSEAKSGNCGGYNMKAEAEGFVNVGL